MTKIVVFVEGGNVQSIYSTRPVEVEVVDFDNLKEQGLDSEARNAELDRATAGMTEAF